MVQVFNGENSHVRCILWLKNRVTDIMVPFPGNHYSLYKFLQYKKNLVPLQMKSKTLPQQSIINGGQGDDNPDANLTLKT